ncbi:hypothetical protein ABEY50_12585 [Priestia megaterium]|uniref:hypothetical protein n=1 Tax=Priestia megaterium TaxID=1404 RepID=UPI000BF385B7|nr:hypothetical protein [Priestia megaterium]RCX28702.1 hypothetical protein DEU47_101254 [Bacillus sp. AG236]MDC7722800.1 hypothetical protein [Priestia megaterium]MEB2290421.1 hypothetical protein [Priestia megaterium]MEE3892252.1 hypothetical protein [Priestia megaterium]PFJ98603.1 hypothetical protein COI96_22925 [Priestia megaterium]
MYSPQEALLASSFYFVFIVLSFIISFFIGKILIMKSNRSVGEIQAISLFVHLILFGTNFRYWWWGHSMSILNIFEFLATTFVSVLIFIASEFILYFLLKKRYKLNINRHA